MAHRRMAVPRESWKFSRRFRRPVRRRHVPGRVEGVPAEWRQLAFESLDGLTGTAWLLRSGQRLAVVVHGLGAGIDSAEVVGAELASRGYSVLLCPLRGHDDMTARTTSGGPEESYDLLGALDGIQLEGFPPSRTLLYGSSMGAGICLKAAGITGSTYLGIVLHAVVPDFFAAARRRLGGLQSRLLLRMLPTGVRHGLLAWNPLLYASLMSFDTPVAAICGSRDAVSTPQEAERAAGCARRSMVAVLGGAHHPDWLSERTDMYQYRAALDRVLAFMDSDDDVIRMYIDENGKVRNLPSSQRMMGARP